MQKGRVARIVTVTFVLLVLFGFWFQKNYMEVYSLEFKVSALADRTQTELMDGKGIYSASYKDGRVKSTIHNKSAKYLNNGHLLLRGNLLYSSYSKVGKLEFTLSTETADGYVQRMDNKRSFSDSEMELETIHMPKQVNMWVHGEAIRTKNVFVDLSNNNIMSRESFFMDGPSGIMEGKDFSYNMNSEEFLIHAPLKGVFYPGANKESL